MSLVANKYSRAIAFMIRHWVLTFGIGLLGGLLCWNAAWTYVSKPELNPSPRQKIVIEGKFPFSSGVELHLVAGFSVTNPTCVSNDRLFGVIGTGGKNYKRLGYVLPVEKLPDDRYRTEFYVDYLQPGFCDWSYGSLSENSYDPKLSPPSNRVAPLTSGFPVHVQRETMQCAHKQSQVPSRKGTSVFGCGPKFMDFPNSKMPSPYNPHISEHPGAAQLDFYLLTKQELKNGV